MKNLDRSSNLASSFQTANYNVGKLNQELEGYKKQADQHWEKFQEADAQAEQFKKEAEKSSALAEQKRQENQGLINRLLNAISSRNSMRGRLGNMTMQRNQAQKRVEELRTQNQEVIQQLKTATVKLGESYQQVIRLQEEYDYDMTGLAEAYQGLSPELRENLPSQLRESLNQIEENYRK